MGRVYEARQQTPERLVAVKVLRDGLASHAMMRRFEQEAELLARLRHPHVAQVHTAGTWRHGDSSVPFFVMELVEGALADRSVCSGPSALGTAAGCAPALAWQGRWPMATGWGSCTVI